MPGSRRPPISRVSATAWPAFGTVMKVCCSQPPRGCRPGAVGGGVGATVGAAVGSGVSPGSPATIRIQPACRVFGSVSSEGMMTTRSRPGAGRRWCPRPARSTTACRRRERCTGSRPATPTATAPKGSLAPGELEPVGVALAEGLSLPVSLGLGLAEGCRPRSAGGPPPRRPGDAWSWRSIRVVAEVVAIDRRHRPISEEARLAAQEVQLGLEAVPPSGSSSSCCLRFSSIWSTPATA